MNKLKGSVFISYANTDKVYAEALARALKVVGANVWYDKDILAGADWDAEIQESLRSASVVVVIVSPDSIASQWVSYEIGSAIAASVPVIAVIVRDVIELPIQLRSIQTLDARGLGSAEMGAKVVVEVISGLQGGA